MVTTKKRLVLGRKILFALTRSALVGCAQTKFGGKMVTVTLTSSQPADAYLIPSDKYETESSEPIDVICTKVNSRFRGPTPATVKILPYMWVYVAKSKAGQFSRPMTFSPDELTNGYINAEFP